MAKKRRGIKTGVAAGRPPKLNIPEENIKEASKASAGFFTDEMKELLNQAPEDLGAIGSKAWAILKITCKNILEDEDELMLLEMCIFYEEYKYLQKLLKLGSANGGIDSFYRASNGQFNPHPLYRQRNDAWALFTSTASQFGLTPANRRSIFGVLDSTATDQEEFMNRYKNEAGV